MAEGDNGNMAKPEMTSLLVHSEISHRGHLELGPSVFQDGKWYEKSRSSSISLYPSFSAILFPSVPFAGRERRGKTISSASVSGRWNLTLNRRISQSQFEWIFAKILCLFSSIRLFRDVHIAACRDPSDMNPLLIWLLYVVAWFTFVIIPWEVFYLLRLKSLFSAFQGVVRLLRGWKFDTVLRLWREKVMNRLHLATPLWKALEKKPITHH